MSGEGNGVVDKAAEHFGYLIAYLLPGLAGLWAASYCSPVVKTWLTEAATHDTSVGGFLFLMVAAVGVGMAVQALRWCVFDHLLPKLGSAYLRDTWGVGPRPRYDESRANEAGVQAALIQIRDQHYRYYQSQGGLAVALPIVFVAWLFCHGAGLRALYLGPAFLALEAVLFFAALDANRRGRDKRLGLLGELSREEEGPDVQRRLHEGGTTPKAAR